MESPGTTGIKNLLSKLKDSNPAVNTYELIISYHCSGEQDPFRETLKQLLQINHAASPWNNCLYKLPKALPAEKIISLALEIETEFNKYDEDFTTEGFSDEGTTEVCFILPNGNKLEIKELIIYPAKKTKKK
jgi:hypothetical protein